MPKTADPLQPKELLHLANMLMALKGPIRMQAEYTNYRGETATRVFSPIRVWYGATDWHPQPGLLLQAHDHGKNAVRDFALGDFKFDSFRLVG